MAKRSRKHRPNRTGDTATPRGGIEPNVQVPNRDGLWATLLFLFVVVTYTPVCWAGYVWDDDFMVTANVNIVGPLGLGGIWTTAAADICPLTLTTIWIIHAIFGLLPLPYHLVNVVLHGLAGIVLWRVLLLLRVPGAWLGSALWALHPVAVESVAWISEMKNAQSGLFFLLSVFFFVKSLRVDEKKARRAWNWNDSLTCLFAALAMASKSSTIVLPLVLCLCAWWIEGRWNWRNLLRVAPMFLLSIAAGLLTIWTQQWSASLDLPYARSWPERLATAGDAICFYLGKLAWPHPLLMIYPLWHIDTGQVLSWLPLVAAIAMAIVFWWKRQSWARPWFFAFAYFVIALLPVLGLVTNSYSRFSYVADHFQYLASMGPLALLGALLTKAADLALPGKALLQAMLGAALLLVASATSWCQAWNYQSQEKLWLETLKYNPDCWEACTNIGSILLERGKMDDAILLYQRALRGNPNSAVTWFNLGLALSDKGRPDEGMTDYERAVKIYPDYAVAHNAIGCALLDKEQVDDAISHFNQAIAADSVFASPHYNLGRAFVQKGQIDDAIIEFRSAVAIKPAYTAAQFALGGYLGRRGHAQEGLDHLRIAVQLDPSDDGMQVGLGLALEQNGQVDDAVARFQKARELNPQNENAAYHLGRMLLQLGRVDEAIGQFRQALELSPVDARVHNNLGVALGEKKQIADAVAEFKEALRLKPDFADARNNLAVMQAQAAKGTNH